MRLLIAMLLILTCGCASMNSAPRVFSPGVISAVPHEAAPAFSPDGRSVWFGRGDNDHFGIYVSHAREGGWSPPTIASFSGQWKDMEPAMSPSGRYMIFVSNRPASGSGAPLDGFFMGKSIPGGGGNLWLVDRRGDDWGVPERLPDALNSSSSTFAPAIAADRTIYFMRPADKTGNFQLFCARWLSEHFAAPEPLPFSDGTESDVDPVIAPDQSFMIFASSRKPARSMDLFIVRRVNGVWGQPVHLGDTINSAGSDAEARLSPDGRMLYFSSERIDSHAGKADWNNGKYNIWQVPVPRRP